MKYIKFNYKICLFIALFSTSLIGQFSATFGQIPEPVGFPVECNMALCANPPSTNPYGSVSGLTLVEYGQTVTYSVQSIRDRCDRCATTYQWSATGGTFIGSQTGTIVTIKWNSPSGSVGKVNCSISTGSCNCGIAGSYTSLNVCICQRPSGAPCTNCNTSCKSYISNLNGTLKVKAPTDNALKLDVYKMDYSTLSSSLTNQYTVALSGSLDIATSSWASGFYAIRVNSAQGAFLQELRFVK
jgi:hypothetical protein